MKKVIVPLMMLVAVLCQANAQDAKVKPAYWVVETNIKQRNFSIVRMYDSQNKLVHEVRMDGVYFDINKTRHRRKLDELLKGCYPVISKREITPKQHPAKTRVASCTSI